MAMDALIILTRGMVAVVDQDDMDRELWCEFDDGFRWIGGIANCNWYAQRIRGIWYASARVGERTLRLHRALACAVRGIFVDHKDGDGLNNRQGNLRLATNALNQRNAKRRIDNTTGFKGVSFNSRSRRYVARLRLNGELRYLGTFLTAEAAALEYDRAAALHFGEYARLNAQLSTT